MKFAGFEKGDMIRFVDSGRAARGRRRENDRKARRARPAIVRLAAHLGGRHDGLHCWLGSYCLWQARRRDRGEPDRPGRERGAGPRRDRARGRGRNPARALQRRLQPAGFHRLDRARSERRRGPGASEMTASASDPKGGVAPVSRRVMNLSHFVRQAARRHGQEIGLAWGDATWTWAEIDRRVDAMAAALAAKGVAKGDRVLVQSKNGNQMFESMFACFRLGAVWVPTNFRQTPGEVAYLGQASGASAMICHGDFPEHAAAATDLRFVVSI